MVQTGRPHEELLAQDDKYLWHSMKPYNPNATIVATKAEGLG